MQANDDSADGTLETSTSTSPSQSPVGYESVYRVTVFIPPGSVERVISGVREITRISYGNYEGVLWRSATGEERHCPLEDATPTAGVHGQPSRESSVQLVFSIPRDPGLLDRVVRRGLIPHHPWEEPVILVDEALATRTQTAASPLPAATRPERNAFIEAALRANAEWGRIADPKLLGVALFLGLALASLVTNADQLPQARTAHPVAGWLATASFGIALIFAAVTMLCALFGLYPRTNRQQEGSRSHYFFAGIQEYLTSEEYREALHARSDEDHERDLVHQTWAMAKVAMRKHRWVKRSYVALAIFAVAWAVTRVTLTLTG